MKLVDIDLSVNGKKYFCEDVNETFTVEYGNLVATTSSFSMADLLKFDFEEVKETENPYERVNINDRYYFVNDQGGVDFVQNLDDYFDNIKFNSLNYFNNKDYAEYIAFKENLMRKLDKFAWEHNARVINWERNSKKYYITFDIDIKNLVVCWRVSYKSNDVFFTSKEIAKKALKAFKDDLIKLYTWEFDF